MPHTPRQRANPELKAEQLAYTEQQILTVRRASLIERNVAAKYGVTTRTVRNWCNEVRAKWRADAESDPDPKVVRQKRRDNARHTLELVIGLALARTEIVKDDEGAPMRDPATGQPITRAKPDLQRVVNAMNAIRHLDGLDEPLKAQLDVTGLGDRLPNLDALPAHVRDMFVKGLEQLAPDGDLRALAGDLFRGSSSARRDDKSTN